MERENDFSEDKIVKFKIQNFDRDRSLRQTDHYFKLYLTKILHGSDCLGSRIVKFYQTLILGMAD